MYKKEIPNVNDLDSFKGSLIKTSEGLLTLGNTHALFVEGGAGLDVFEILHSNSALSLHGGLDGATYNVRSFIDEKGDFIVNKGLISLAGKGSYYNDTKESSYVNISGKTTLNYYATTLDDVVYSCESILSSCCELQTIGIDEFRFYGGDNYYVMGSERAFEHKMFVDKENGKKLLYIGDDLTEGLYRTQIERLRRYRSKTIELITENLDNIPIIKEGETFEYGIKLSQKPQGKVSVKISVPLTSDVEERNKNSGILLVDEKGNYCSSIVKEFDSSNYNSLQKIKIVYVGDDYVDDNDVAFLMQDVESTSSADKVDFMMNVPILLSDESSGNTVSVFNSPMCDKLGFDVVNSSVILCDRPEIDLTKLSLASLRFVNEAGKVTYISTSKTSGSDYWYKAERNKIYIYSASGDELVPITGRLDYVNMLTYYDSSTHEEMNDLPYYGLDNCFILNSSTFQLSYATSPSNLQLIIGEDRYDLSTTPSETGYYVKVSGNQFVIYSGETGLPIEVTGFLHLRETYPETHGSAGASWFAGKRNNSTLGGSFSKEIYQKGLSFARVGDDRSYETIGDGLREVNGFIQVDLGRLASPSQEYVLNEGDYCYVNIDDDSIVCFKIPISMSTTSSVSLMVNGLVSTLPELTWSWDDTNKKRKNITKEMDWSYQINVSDALIEDEFIYVYLHAATHCNFVVSALVS